MAKRVKLHVAFDKNSDKWKVMREKSKGPSAYSETKQGAINRGRELAQKQEKSRLIIHKKDGSIQTEYTYGMDPRKYKG